MSTSNRPRALQGSARIITLLASIALCACADASEPFVEIDRCDEQLDAAPQGLPADLDCTGLYSNIERGTLAKGVESFEPAFTLWSDGAEKTRWIKLPAGEQIDTSDMKHWRFPLGTKLWKEFRADGAKVETRVYLKLRSDRWVGTTYIWNEAESRAQRHDTGRRLTRNGVDYEVPQAGKCDDCHDGQPDNPLGFEAVSLGVGDPEREGWTLRKLVDRELLSDPPQDPQYVLGDDGTGKAADALGWLHINCGVACHNDNINAKAEITGLRMLLDPAQLDGRPANEFQSRALLLDVPAVSEQWRGQKRIVPGKPEESLLYRLITTRIGEDSNKQMPPLATRVVDEDGAAKVREWILALRPSASE